MHKLRAAGFDPATECDGHIKLVKPGRVVVVPPAAGGAELAVGTLRAVLQQVGMERSEFDALTPLVEDAVQ